MLFFFNDTATTEIYTLSLHDALPISGSTHGCSAPPMVGPPGDRQWMRTAATSSGSRSIAPPGRAPGTSIRHGARRERSEEHTSELQSQSNLVCRLLLEKKKKKLTDAT